MKWCRLTPVQSGGLIAFRNERSGQFLEEEQLAGKGEVTAVHAAQEVLARDTLRVDFGVAASQYDRRASAGRGSITRCRAGGMNLVFGKAYMAAISAGRACFAELYTYL